MLRDLVVYTTFHLTRKQTPHSHKQHNRNENFGYMTSNESIGLRVSHTQYKRIKKIQQGAFMKEIFSDNSGTDGSVFWRNFRRTRITLLAKGRMAAA